MIDTSTEAIAELMKGVIERTPHAISAPAGYISESSRLIPALAAERDAMRAEVERLRAELSGAADVFAGIADHILSAKGTDIPPNHKGIFADCQRAGMKIRATLKGAANG